MGDEDPSLAYVALGVDATTANQLRHALREAAAGRPLAEVATLRGALKVLRTTPRAAVFVGSQGVEGSWEDSLRKLRHAAPESALVAVCPDPASSGATPSSAFDGWDDAVFPEDVEPRLLARVLRSARAVVRANVRLSRWALRDPLTNVANRRGLERWLQRETAARERGQGPLSAMLVDCDDFKRVNDNHGLAVGDRTLRQVADTLVRAVRSGDTVARVGGDEFLILLPQTRTWEAVEIAERVRIRVPADVALPDGSSLSVSIGVRRLEAGVSSLGEVLASVQGGLRLSKATGKDRVHVAEAGDPLAAPDADTLDTSMPPKVRPYTFRRWTAVLAEDHAPARHVLHLGVADKLEQGLAAQRAAQVSLDLHWFDLALKQALDPSSTWPVHVQLFPPTLLALSASSKIVSKLPDGLPS